LLRSFAQIARVNLTRRASPRLADFNVCGETQLRGYAKKLMLERVEN